METLRGCCEHARSGHTLTRPCGPQPEPGPERKQRPRVCSAALPRSLRLSAPSSKYYSGAKDRGMDFGGDLLNLFVKPKVPVLLSVQVLTC